MKRTLLCLVLLLALCLSSCGLYDLSDYLAAYQNGSSTETTSNSQYITESELKAMINEEVAKAAKNLTIEEGDTYDVTVEASESFELVGASSALLSTVSIVTTFQTQQYVFSRYGYQLVDGDPVSFAGSGVIYDLDKVTGSAYIITNYHVVYYASALTSNKISDDINVYLYGQESKQYAIPATYVGGSMYYDIAVLKVSNSDVLKASHATEAVIANSDDVSVLETAIAIGNPEGLGISATVGHINVVSEYISMTAADEKTALSMRVIRVDTAVNGGNSGGGLYNKDGELIGIVNAKLADSSVDNIGYAIPSNVAVYVTKNILDYCDGKEEEHLYRCMVGITVEAAASTSELDMKTGKVHIKETVKVSDVSSTGIANGVLAVGDVIKSITIDGNTYNVSRIFHVVDNMLNARVGSSVVFHVERNGESLDVPIAITASALTQY